MQLKKYLVKRYQAMAYDILKNVKLNILKELIEHSDTMRKN